CSLRTITRNWAATSFALALRILPAPTLFRRLLASTSLRAPQHFRPCREAMASGRPRTARRLQRVQNVFGPPYPTIPGLALSTAQTVKAADRSATSWLPTRASHREREHSRSETRRLPSLRAKSFPQLNFP